MLESSTKLSTLGMLDSAEATELMTSTLNGFNLTAKESESVVDKLVKVDLDYATSAGEIATALRYTAASAGMAGVSLDEMIGMITIVSSTTRRSAESIGQSFKTIFSRLQNVAAGKDIDDAGESLNDVEKSLNRVGIATRNSLNEWRDASEIFDEVGSKWSSFTDIQRSQITTALGGTRQRENLIVLFNNWNKVTEATNKATDSAGTAEQKYSIYLESIDAKINEFIATWEQLVNNLNQSDTFAGIVELGTHLLELVDKLHLVEIAVGGAVAGFALFGASKIPKAIDGIASAVVNLTNIINGLSEAQDVGSFFSALFPKISESSGGLANALKGLGTGIFTNLLKESSRFNRVYEQTLTLSGDVSIAFRTATNDLKNFITTDFSGFIASLANSKLAIMGITTAILVATAALYDFFDISAEEHWDSFSDVKTQFDDAKTEVDSLNQELQTTREQIDALTSKGTLTLTEAEDLRQLRLQNEELTRQLALQQKIKESAGKQASEEAYNALTDTDDYTSVSTAPGAFGAAIDIKTRVREGNELISTYQEEIKAIEEEQAALDSTSGKYKRLENEKEKLVQKMNEEIHTTSGIIDTMMSYASSLDMTDPKQKELYNSIMDLSDGFLIATDSASFFNDRISNLATLDVDTSAYNDSLNDLMDTLVTTNEGNDILENLGFSEDEINNVMEDWGENWSKYLAGEEVKDKDFNEFIEKLKEAILRETFKAKVELEVTNASSTGDALNSLSTLEGSLTSLSGAFDDFDESGRISVDTLNDIFKTFGSLENIDGYIDRLMDANLTTEDLKSVTVDMMNEYINQEGILDNLTGEQEAYALSLLEANGYVVTETAKMKANTDAKVDAWAATQDLSQVTANDMVKALNLEGTEAEIAKAHFYDLQASMIRVNNQDLNFSQQMSKLRQLGIQAGLTAAQMSGIFGTDAQNEQSIRLQLQAEDLSFESSEGQRRYQELQNQLFVNSQNAMIDKVLENANVIDDIVGGYTPPSSGGGSSSDSGEDPIIEAFEAELEELQHLYAMGKISRREYYDGLKALDAKYYAGNEKYLSEHRKNLEEMRQLQGEIYDEEMSNIDAEIEVLEDQGNKEEEILALRRQQMEFTHQMADAYRAAGVSEDSDLIKDLQSKYREYAREVKQLQTDIVDNGIDELDRYAEYLEAIGELDLQTQINLSKSKLDIIEEYARKGYLTEEEYLERWIDAAEKLKDDIQSQYEALRDYNVKIIEDQIDALEQQKDEETAYYDEKIERIKEQLDLLDEEEEKRDKILDLEEKQLALDEAKSQKNIQIYREGIGFVWEADPTAIQDAQNDYNDVKRDYEKWELEEQLNDEIEALEDAKEAVEENFDAQIDELEKLKEKWEESLDISDAVDGLSEELQRMVLNGDMSFEEMSDILDDFVDSYLDEMDRVEEKTKNLFASGTTSSRSRTWYVNADGSAPSEATVGDKIITTDGIYQIVAPNTQGASYNPQTGKWSKKIDDVKASIDDSLWGTEVLNSSIENNSSILEDNTDSNYDVYDGLDDNTDELYWNSDELYNNTGSIEDLTYSIDDLGNIIADTDFGGGSSGGDGGDSGGDGGDSGGSSGGGSGGSSGGSNINFPAGAPYANQDPNEMSSMEQLAAQLEIENYLDRMAKLYGTTSSRYIELRDAYNELWDGVYRFAKGTTSSPEGFAMIDEEGSELTIRPTSQGRLDYLGLGTGVVPADLTKRIIDVAMNPYGFFQDTFSDILRKYQAPTTQATAPSISIGDIILHDVQNVDELSQAIINYLPNQMVKNLYRR